MTHPILAGELSSVSTFHCHHNPMITDEDTGIIKQVACGLASGREALSSFSLSSPAIPLPPLLLSLPGYSHLLPLGTTAVLTGLFSLMAALTLLLTRQRQKRKYKTAQK